MDARSAQPAQRIRILVAEDHGLMMEAILTRLQGDTEIEVVEAVSDGRALVDAYTRLLDAGETPDVVLCDHSMPEMSGVAAIEQILARNPEARILILSAFDDQALVVSAMAAGAVGYILKSLAPEDLREKVRAAARGEAVFDARTVSHMIGAVRQQQQERLPGELRGAALSAREIEVLRLVAEGLTNAEIGRQLFISAQTVKTHLERICTKLQVSGRTAAVRKAVETGILRSG
jgi:DNA-binding NarL/FixJ family response regulator